MSFSLPELPYAYDALAPYMSRETLEYHHDKHHQAYVDTGNKLLKGSGWEGKSLEDIVKGYRSPRPTWTASRDACAWATRPSSAASSTTACSSTRAPSTRATMRRCCAPCGRR